MNKKYTLLVLTILLHPLGASAQPDTFYVDAHPTAVTISQALNQPGSTAPAKPYWRLNTGAGARNTQVRFFDASDRLLYEETLVHQYVRLTPRNLARLNNILDRLVNCSLVVNTLKTKTIDERPSGNELSVRAEHARLTAAPTETNPKGYPIEAYSIYQIPQDRLVILLTNPDRYPMKIVIWQEGHTKEAYFEIDNGTHYQRKLNLNKLSTGNYKLIITSIDNKFYYSRSFTIRR